MIDLIKINPNSYVILDYGIAGAESCAKPKRISGQLLDIVDYLLSVGLSEKEICMHLEDLQEATEILYCRDSNIQ